MRTNVLNDLSNVVKKGTSRVQVGYKVEEETLAGSWSQRGQISGEGAIEHPLSTHSAPFGIRWKPAGEKGSTRVWKHVAMIFAVLVMSMANIGMAWGAEKTYTVQNPAASKRYVQDNIMMTGTTASKKIANSSNQNVFYLQSGSYAPTCVISKAANIKKVVIYGNRDTNGSSQATAFNLQASTNAIDFSVPTSGFTATKQDNGDPAALGSLSAINMIGNNQSYATTVTVTFTSPVMAIRLVGTASVSIKSIAVTYDDAITVDPELCEVHMTSTTAAALTGTGTWTATNIQSGNNYTDASSNTYYYDKSSGTYGKIDLGAGNTFQEGDEIWFEMNGNGLRAPGACGYRLNSSNSTSGAVTIQPTCSIAANMPMFMHYVTKSTDPWVGQQVLWILRYDSNDRLYQVTIHRAAGGGGATSHSVSAVTSTGTNDYGTVSAAASSVAEGGTTTITAVPASGYRVTNWSVSGTGASISPSGASNANSTTLTMGTADATVTVTFGAIPTHSITYTNLKGADNSANPTTYTEGVGVASFANLRHLVGYDFTGWSPSSISSSATTDQTIDAQWTTRAAATGTGTLIYNFGYSDNTITTSSITRNNGALYDATNLTWTGVTIDDSESAERSGKITTTKSYDSDKYLTLTFKIADGYTFTPTEVQLKAVAVSDNKTIRFEFTDNAGTPNTKYVEQTRSSGSSVGTLTYDFDASDPVTLTGTVTVKIYAYGATNSWRLGTPLTITGTVASAAPSCTAPNHVDISGDWDYFGGETISLSAQAYSSAGTGSPIAEGSITGYQWKHNGVDIVGATSKTFTKSNCTVDDAGDYSCVVSTGATCSTESSLYGTKVYVLQQYIGGETTYNFTRTGSSQAGTVEVTLPASTQREFKIYAGSTASTTYYMGNNGTIDEDASNWDFEGGKNNVKLNPGLGGTFIFSIDYSANGGAPKVSVTYPRKRIYLSPGVWKTPSDGEKFAYNYYRDGGSGGWTDFLTEDDCGMYADIPQWNGVILIPARLKNTTVSPGSWDDRWNQTNNITVTSNDYVTITGWNASDFTYTTYSTPTYTISYNAGTGGSGSKSNETKTCGVDFTLPNSAVFTRTGYTQTGWAISDGGSQAYALGGTYTTNEDKTFYPVWTVNNYDLTWNLAGGTTTSAGTGIGSGVSSNTTTSQAFGTALTAPTVTKTGYNFSAWSPAVASTMPAANTTYTAQWTAKTTTITIDANTSNHGSTAPSPITATYGSALPSFTAASGVGDWNLTGYWTAATGGNKIINANGTLVASTSYADGSSHWNSEVATLTLYAQYEEECTPQTISKVVLTAVDAGTVSGYNENEYAGAAVIGGLKSTQAAEVDASHAGDETGYKLNDNGKGIVFATLAKGTFQVGDVIKVTITKQNDNYEFGAPINSKDALELFYGTNKDDATSLTILTGVSAAGTYSYTLTAADVTAIGSKKGIGVFRHSDRKQNPFVYSVEIYGCRDWVIEEEGLVNWTMNLNTETWGTSSTSTTDETNISSISTSANTTDGTREGTTKKINLASAADNVNNAASFTFSLNSAKKIEPEKVTCKVFNVGDDEGLNYKAQLSDDNGHVYYSTNTVIPNTEATLTDAVFNFASDLILTGDITVKVYCWKSSGSGSAFRMGPKIRFFGEVQSAADYTVTHTMSNVTKSAGATSVKEGNNYTATYAGAGGYALPSTITVTIGGSPATAGTDYTWTQGTGVVSIPGNKVTGNIVITVTGVAVVNYSITYHCNGAESGCPSNVAATTNLPSPLPTGLTKDGYDFGGWFTDSECTVAAVAGAALTGNTDLYAKWTERGSECEDTPHAWDVIATGAKSYKVRISKVTEEVAIPVADATASNLTAYAGSVSTNDNVTVQIADGGSSQYGYKFDGSNTYLKLVFSTPLVLNDTLVVGMTNASHNISFTTTAARATTLSTSGGKLIIPAALAGQSTLYLWRGSGSTMYMKSLAVKHACDALPSCTPPTLPTLSNQSLCEGADIAEWNATVTNASAISAAGETVTYSWKKKGNATELANTASFDLGSSAAESQAGTYVVTVTVSKAGYASATATKEVTLTVNEATEVTGITADKATVYPTNSVTLTATANMDATWQWYTCTNAEGAGESSIGGATSASYTIASAGSAGTYYYKVKATGSCGIGSMVYTLTVSAASECEKYFWFVYAADATTNGVVNNRDGFFTSAPTGSSNSSTYKFTLDGTEYKATKNTGSGSFSISFTIPEGSTATMGINCKGSSSKPLYLTHSSGTPQKLVSNSSSNASCTVEDITEGTWTLTSAGSWTLAALGVQVCTTSTCTDATPTIAAANTTVCVGSELSISSTGYETGATFQWQKLNSSTSTWDNISGASSATYTVATAAAEHAGSYRLVATKGCARTSNTVTISVPSAPNFGSTIPASVSVMQTIALSINTVEASDATKYKWYKSADGTWDAGDVEIGTNKELIKAYDGEAIGSPSYYIFCRAQNSCGIATSTAIAVNVTAYVEEDCATRGNEGDAEFGFENTSAGQGSYQSTNCWTMNSNSKYLTYTAPEGKYFKTAKVTIASSSENKASYNWSTNGGTSYTAVSLTVNSTLTERTINLSAHGNVNAFQIGRNFDSKGSSGGTLYVSKICFEYTEACTATTVTPSATSKIYEMGGAWSNPTFTVKYGGTAFDPQPTLSYSSSNEDIASVDDDGTVTFNGEAGTVTITASYAGGTISETEYCASSGSYTINVSCPGGAPKVVPDGSTDMSGCNTSVTLHAKKQDGTAFDDGTYQWFRNGEEIDGATSSSYTATQAGTYTVERTNTSGCTTPSTTSAVVTSETTEPEVERLVPFQYYHVNKTYSDQMKMRHLFAVKNSGTLDGKHFKMYVSRNGAAATDVTSSNALVVWPSNDGHVDTVMVDLNKLSGKYSENDELVYTCKAIDCSGNVSDVYKNTITMNVIGAKPTLALICSGTSKAEGTRKTSELTVGGDFLTGYNVADLCQQTGNTSFDANTEWGLYTDLKANYIVTPVNGYAVFNKLNYEPFDILLLTDYPKASKSDAAKDVLDDMAALCDYRPMLSFKTHMVAKSPSKWAAKGFTTSATENKADGRLNLNIVCYAHPMFDAIKTGDDVYNDTENTSAPLIYTMLSGTGHEGNKGMQGFEIAAAENFVTIGLTHYNATIAKVGTNATWTPSSEDRMLVTVAERQTNIEARMILFSLNCGAQSKLTDKGEQVVLACLNYLLETDPLKVADCSFTFDNGASNEHNAAWYAEHCPGCTGTKGDGLWSTAANWAPDYRLLPGEFTSVRIAAPVTVDLEHAHVLDARIKEGGQIIIPAGKGLDMKGTIRRLDGSEISPTENSDLFLGSTSAGNGSLIFNNDKGDTKATVAMYTTALADIENMSATTSTWQYIGTPHNDVARATYNYYDSWLYQYSGSGWEVIPNGGPLVPFRGYCVTHPQANHTFVMYGTLTATTNVDIDVPAGYTVIANSWVAPIDITTLTDDDMEGIDDKTIYFFNTGSDAEGENGTGTAPGTYVAVPKNAASYVGNWQIPSMQGFYLSSSTAGTLHLDYGRHVRPAGERTTIVNNPMYAPRRAKAADEEPLVLKMFARGSRYHDKLVVLEREDFTTGYDSGWDGEAWGGSDLSPQIYVIGGGRYDAVSAIPDFEGTVVAFCAGEDEAYTIDFIYDAENEPLYLFDTENNSYTQIVTGGAYHFTTSDKAAHSRFILTRHAPQIATGCENLDGGEGAKAKKLLIEDKMFIMVNGLLYDATGKVVK